MANLLKEKIDEIKELYFERGLSVREVANKLGVLPDAIYSYLRRQGVQLRTPSESNKLVFERKELSFSIKQNLTAAEKELLIAGIMLYWGEGAKADKNMTVDFANSNPEMIDVFLIFLRNICGITEQKIKIFLYCYANQNPRALIEFWSSRTSIPKEQFTKPYIWHDFDPAKIGKMKYGLIHIRYGDKRLLAQIKEWIAKYARDGTI